MNLEDDHYYIVIHNYPYMHQYDVDEYHLEKIFTREQILEIIEKEIGNYFDLRFFAIVTNDETFLNKYIFTINLDEFKLLCEIPEYEANNIRLNCNYFYGFHTKIYPHFLKIFNGDIISASEHWTTTKGDYFESGDEYFHCQYEGWIENIRFCHFKTPERYRKNNEGRVFHNKDYKKGNIEIFKKLLNVNILEIGTDLNPNINWEWCDGKLRYYDEISKKRLYITEELLQILRNDNEINLLLSTTLDKNFYIEYFVTGIDYPISKENIEFESESNSLNDFSYDKYKGSYGYDDDSIDSAFEGDAENYWNID